MVAAICGVCGGGGNIASGGFICCVFGFNELGIGTSVKYVRQYVDSDSKSTFGFDTGLILSKFIDYHICLGIHKNK